MLKLSSHVFEMLEEGLFDDKNMRSIKPFIGEIFNRQYRSQGDGTTCERFQLFIYMK